MAKQTLNSSIRRCATCEYWTGSREVISGGSQVAVDNLTDVRNRAECANPRARTYQEGCPPANACCGMHYVKWSRLR